MSTDSQIAEEAPVLEVKEEEGKPVKKVRKTKKEGVAKRVYVPTEAKRLAFEKCQAARRASLKRKKELAALAAQ